VLGWRLAGDARPAGGTRMNDRAFFSRRGQWLLGLGAALGAAGLIAASPGCNNGAATSSTGSGTGATSSGGTGGTGGTGTGTGGSGAYIPADKCKLVGAANEVKADDPLAMGQCLFLLDAWGSEVLDEWPPADFMLDLMKKEPDVFGNQFEKFGFLPDPNDDFPIGFKRGLHDPTKVHETCAMCHTGKLPDGRVWFGEPNVNLDFARFQVEVDKRWVAAGNPTRLSDLSKQKALATGPGRVGAETSDYPYLVGADFPPYFTLAKRTRLNYLGTSKNVRTEAFLGIYTFGAGAPNDATAKVPFPLEDRIDTFLAFFGQFAPPAGPTQDAALVAQGKMVFDSAKCGSCHHVDDVGQDGIVTYDKAPDGKERLPGDDPAFPKGSIRTDIMHRVLIDDSVGPPQGGSSSSSGGGTTMTDTGFADLIAFITEHKLGVLYSDGYCTLDLHGLWATAPYLHNGSVPTLEDLLKKPADRPVTWKRGDFTFDTTLLGNSNQGHEFGTDLPDADKTALVAYLKSL
jgi:mono/diheme cytochrome c family protein